MRILFEMDAKNYKEGGTVGRRPSVRGIIFGGGKLAMVHSLKYDYYKFPGGGIEDGETHEKTLCREVMEETGLGIHPATIREYGLVVRKEKGNPEDVFIQENFYYLARVTSQIANQKLDDYEAEEQFTLEWVDIADAVEVNEKHSHGELDSDIKFKAMLNRENFVLKKLLEENVTYKQERAVMIVVRGDKILMERVVDGHEYYDLPGGGIEKGETPEEAAVRELKEECGLNGHVVRKLLTIYFDSEFYDEEHSFLMEVDENQVESTGGDPELNPEDQIIKEVKWMRLDEIPERDRAWLFWRGLLEIPQFKKIAFSWKNQISYPEY